MSGFNSVARGGLEPSTVPTLGRDALTDSGNEVLNVLSTFLRFNFFFSFHGKCSCFVLLSVYLDPWFSSYGCKPCLPSIVFMYSSLDIICMTHIIFVNSGRVEYVNGEIHMSFYKKQKNHSR